MRHVDTIDLDGPVPENKQTRALVIAAIKETLIGADRMVGKWEDGELLLVKTVDRSDSLPHTDDVAERFGNFMELIATGGVRDSELPVHPGERSRSFVTEFKIMMGMNIAERRFIQMGAVQTTYQGKPYLLIGTTSPRPKDSEDILLRIMSL